MTLEICDTEIEAGDELHITIHTGDKTKKLPLTVRSVDAGLYAHAILEYDGKKFGTIRPEYEHRDGPVFNQLVGAKGDDTKTHELLDVEVV